MEITDVTCHPVHHGRDLLLVRVETDTGLVGWGESGLTGRERAVTGAVRHFREFLLGRDPRRTGALWQRTYRSQYFEGGRVLTAALSAIDMACHDVHGRHLGVPVYELLGGRHRDYVPGFASAPYPGTPDAIDEVASLVDDGWRAIRVGFHHPEGEDPSVFEPRDSIGPTAAALADLREEIGHDPTIGLDYHHRLTVPQTISFCERLPPGALDFLEEPIRDQNPEAYASLAERVSVPLAVGEEIANKWDFRPYVERGLTDFARVDLGNVGGFTEAMKVAGMCEAHYVDLMPHNPLGPVATAATGHFALAVPNLASQEFRPSLRQFEGGDYFDVGFDRDGSRLYLSDEPGLGVTVDEDALADATVEFETQPHLRREDGSVQNW
jgi:galactonate dehydratase